MKKYIIIAALGLCNNTWAMKHSPKVDNLDLICTKSGWLPTKNLSHYPQQSQQWDNAVTSILIEHDKTRMNNKKFSIVTLLGWTIPRRAKL